MGRIPAPRDDGAALVTGASSGIGAELARDLAERGHNVVLVARREDRLRGLADELHTAHGVRAEVAAADLTDPAARDAFPARLAEMGLETDVLVLCAGFGMGGPFLEQDPDRILQMVRTNLESTITLSRILLPDMAARKRGAVLIVSSFAGRQPMPNFGAYAATKAGVLSFSDMLGAELRDKGISVTALCPGGVHTEFVDVAEMGAQANKQPSAFFAQPDYIARKAIAGMDRGKRMVMPGLGVKALSFVGVHAPRGAWLRLCQRLMS
jgi:short-subunit dehydrogenase